MGPSRDQLECKFNCLAPFIILFKSSKRETVLQSILENFFCCSKQNESKLINYFLFSDFTEGLVVKGIQLGQIQSALD